MIAVQISFFVLAVAATASSIGVIAFKNPVHSALSLILTLLFLAMFYLQLGAMFIAVVQILIYAGAIMVLFLFVVTMLIPGDTQEAKDPIAWQRILAIILGVVLIGALSFLIFSGNTQSIGVHTQGGSLAAAVGHSDQNVEAFGNALFHGFLFPFEVTSLLIVIAILGALVFGRRA